LEKIAAEVGYPAFVKPLTLGSSIGIAKITDPDKAGLSIDIALNLDRQVMVEGAAPGDAVVEINCAVLGYGDLVRASTLEQPVSYETFLTYQEKYMRDGSQGMKSQERIIPAPLSDDLTARIKQTAIDAFRAIRGGGTARIDFLMNQDTGEFWVNEINTMPGSLAFYLWEPEGLSPTAVCDELIRLAFEVHAEKQATTYNYKSGLIALAAQRGSKGVKGYM
jgi:D-alanine-D-alanine ligase